MSNSRNHSRNNPPYNSRSRIETPSGDIPPEYQNLYNDIQILQDLPEPSGSEYSPPAVLPESDSDDDVREIAPPLERTNRVLRSLSRPQPSRLRPSTQASSAASTSRAAQNEWHPIRNSNEISFNDRVRYAFSRLESHPLNEEIENLRWLFSSMKRQGYSRETAKHHFDNNRLDDLICIGCFNIPADPVYCSGCQADMCRNCLKYALASDNISSETNRAHEKAPCRGFNGGGYGRLGHQLTALPETRRDEYKKVGLYCDYGCKDDTGAPLFFPNFTEGDIHNRVRGKCSFRKCMKCQMWKSDRETDIFPDNCDTHLKGFAEFCFEYQRTRFLNQPPHTRRVTLIYDTERRIKDLQTENDDLKVQNEILNKYLVAEERSKQQIITSLDTNNREISQLKQSFESRFPIIPTEIIPTKQTKTSENISESNLFGFDSTLSITPPTEPEDKNFSCILIPTDEIPRVSEKCIQVYHPTAGLKDLPKLQPNLTWNTLKTVALSLYDSNQVKNEDYELVSFRIRVEKGEKCCNEALHSTHVLNLVPKRLVNPFTAYKAEISNLTNAFRPKELAESRGILLEENPQIPYFPYPSVPPTATVTSDNPDNPQIPVHAIPSMTYFSSNFSDTRWPQNNGNNWRGGHWNRKRRNPRNNQWDRKN